LAEDSWNFLEFTNKPAIVFPEFERKFMLHTNASWISLLSRPNVQPKAARATHGPCKPARTRTALARSLDVC
jgi:hypothetical protein